MRKVLIIDDEDSFLDLIRDHIRLQFPGLTIMTCDDPVHCLASITTDLDLLLVDLEMPGLDGAKVLAYATGKGVDKNRIVIISGRDAEYLHKRFPPGSCLGVLNKFEAEQKEALDMIFRALQDKGRGQERGFTLIELVIVMTVIAILTAIAIPVYRNYKVGSYNAAASSDLRNARSVLESFYSDHGFFPSSIAGGLPGGGAVFTTALHETGAIAAGTIFPPNVPTRDITAPGFSVGISQGVGLVVHTSPVILTFTMGAKNIAGDRCFGMDSDPSALYWINGTSGVSLTDVSIPAPTQPSLNFLTGPGAAGSGVCAGSPPGSGQITWVIE